MSKHHHNPNEETEKMSAYPGPQHEQQQTGRAWPPRTSEVMPPAKRRVGKVAAATLGLLACLVSCSLGYGLGANSKGTAPRTVAPTVTYALPTPEAQAPPPPAVPAPAGPATTIGNGDWVVGQHVQPGTYRTNGPLDGLFMYCQGSTETDGRIADLRNSGGEDGGPIQLELKDGQTFSSTGCQDWTRQP